LAIRVKPTVTTTGARESGLGAAPRVTVLICTYNRASLLDATLESLAACEPPPGGFEVLVVDNASTDSTEAVVEARRANNPVPLRYVFEGRPGKSHALNTGLLATPADIILFTDDDIQVPPHWIAECCRALDARSDVDYVGGPVRPHWEAPPPAWFPPSNGNLWGTVAVLDYGDHPFIFEDRHVVPLGVNMAVRRRVVQIVGGFDASFGRKGRSLLGQEQGEFFCRTRAAGLRGLYVPDMWLHHRVPAERLTRRYFRRWWFWKGISKARLHALHPETDSATAISLAGVPRYLFGEAARRALGWLAAIRTDRARAFEHQMFLAYLAGYAIEHRRSRRRGPARGARGGTVPPQEAAATSLSESTERIG
jgi:glycosyltransferase involved in cell wall biosynthesis